MSIDKNNIVLRNKAVLTEYNKLARIKVFNVQKYSHAAIIELVSQKFFLTPETTAKIVIKQRKLNA